MRKAAIALAIITAFASHKALADQVIFLKCTLNGIELRSISGPVKRRSDVPSSEPTVGRPEIKFYKIDLSIISWREFDINNGTYSDVNLCTLNYGNICKYNRKQLLMNEDYEGDGGTYDTKFLKISRITGHYFLQESRGWYSKTAENHWYETFSQQQGSCVASTDLEKRQNKF